ncbi:alpha/beta fold hydrolase [Rummeliibacillus pycnus]|uniref:alpha/beta fold hydrolase n=1 Tax=Rummeliibacillus pycnus TaxID=101070 RepID=UPI001FE532F1|nr:alpha/beta fold hydrolase [Rummeliibacillus pycnus]
MYKEQIMVTATDQHQLVVTICEPIQSAKGHIHILHGMAEHHERYVPFAEFLTNAGYFVSMHDHRGHGKTVKLNQSIKGFFSEQTGFEKVVEDVKIVTDTVRDSRNLPPMILFGHSMGSFIARRYTELHSEQLDKAIYCGTGAVGIEHFLGAFLAKCLTNVKGKTKESHIMDKLTFGNFNRTIQNPETKFDWLCSNSVEVAKYIADEDCGFISTNQFYVDFLQGIITLSKRHEVNRIRKNLPILFISGAEDPVGGFTKGIWRAAKQMQKCGLHDVTVQLFEGMRHEVLNETNKEKVFQTILQWLEKKECYNKN